MTLSFIVPAFNEEDLLPRTLSSIKEALKELVVNAEIIVVDNNSSDATAQIAVSCGADKVVFEPVNSIAKARNAGAKAASGEIFVFVDADTCVSEALLKELLEKTAKSEVCGGGARLEFDVEPPWPARISTWLWNFLAPHLGLATGSFSFCRRSAFEEIGGFNEELYAAEDVAFSLRLKIFGCRKGFSFEVLRNPAPSSSRRLGKGSFLPFMFKMLFLALTPWRLRSKEACSPWYDHKTRNG